MVVYIRMKGDKEREKEGQKRRISKVYVYKQLGFEVCQMEF